MEKKISSRWGNRLKKYRTMLQLSQSEFAEIFHLESQANVSRYESEENFPSFDIIFKLYEAGLNLNWWASGKGEMIRPDADLKNSSIPKHIIEAIEYAKAFNVTYQIKSKDSEKGELTLKLNNETVIFKDISLDTDAQIIVKNMHIFIKDDKNL